MGSSVGCFGNDNDDNNTICFSLVGIMGVSMVLIVAAVIILCCVCLKRWRVGWRCYNIQRNGEHSEALELHNEVYESADSGTKPEKQAKGEIEEINHLYQEIGIVDYEHMYSKAAPQHTISGKTDSSSQEKEREYAELSITTLKSGSVYTNTCLIKQ